MSYSRIPAHGAADDLQGTFLASYGPHGTEVLLLERSTDAAGHQWLIAKKLTGESPTPQLSPHPEGRQRAAAATAVRQRPQHVPSCSVRHPNP